MEVMALDVAIRAPGGPEAIKTLEGVERAGKRAADVYSSAWSKSSREIIDAVMKSGSASAKAHLQMQLDAQQSAAKTAAATQQRTQKEIQAEANLANHFRQMREREVAAAERAAYAIQRFRDREVAAAQVAANAIEQARRKELAAAERSAYAIDAAMQRSSKRTLDATTRTTNAMTQKYGTAALGIAGALQSIAFSGDLSAGALKQLLTQVGLLAASFGPQGRLIAAVAVGASAIIDLFQKARKELEETRKKFDDELVLLINAGDRAGIQGKMAVLWQGTPAKDFKDGIVSIREELAALDREAAKNALVGVGNIFAGGTSRAEQLRTELKRLEEEFAKLDAAMRKAAAPFRAFTQPTVVTAVSTGIPDARPGPKAIPFGGSAALATGGVGAPGFQGAAGVVAKNMETLAGQASQAILDARASIESAIDEHITRGLGDALHNAFSRAFSGEGIAGLLKGFTAGILSSLGSMFIELGKHLIQFGALMDALKKGLANLLGSGPAAIAVGIGLIALGSLMGAGGGALGGGGGGGSRGGSYGGGRQIVERGSTTWYNPTSMDMTTVKPPVANTYLVMGSNPQLERFFSKVAKKADRRQLGGRGLIRVNGG